MFEPVVWSLIILGFAWMILGLPVRRAPLRQAYHMASRTAGHVRLLGAGRAAFYPGGNTYSFVCQRDELCIGPCVPPTGHPD
jgi:hypothetical protein